MYLYILINERKRIIFLKKERYMELTGEQQSAIDGIKRDLENGKSFITLGGFAGTGKTTVLTELRRHINPKKRVAFASFTGKSASVLRDKIMMSGSKFKSDYVGTIHGLMYRPIIIKKFSESKNEYIETVTFKKLDEIEEDILLIDEASMIGSKIFDDMIDFNVQIVACGDSFQLPPVADTNTEPVLLNPDYQLEEVHRTAQGSPLIKLAHAIRTKQYLPIAPYKDEYIHIQSYFSGGREFLEDIEYGSETVTLCFTNAVRQSINFGYRNKKEFKDGIILYPYEQIVCLTNNPTLGMMNGERFTVEFLSPPYDQDTVSVTVERQDGNYQEAFVHNTGKKFGKKNIVSKYNSKHKNGGPINVKKDNVDPMVIDADYGYAMTVHKSQGSEFNNVCLVDSRIFKGISTSKGNNDYLRWLYTGVTRSSDKLTIITDYPNA
jgi:exodeoxyribonuclease-5